MKPQTSQPEEYEVLVLGSGEAGKYIAWKLAKKGMKTAVITHPDAFRDPRLHESSPRCHK